jgi:LacI family transcriptional regulator
VTLRDVARAAEVHPGTASKALNEATRDRVAPGTVRRVLAAAERLGYQPNTFARGLRTRRSYAVGVVLPDLANPLFPPIVRGVEKLLAKAGYATLIVDTDNDPAAEERLLAMLRARHADGFIIATARREHPVVEKAVADGVPMVLVNRLTDAALVPAVAGDEVAGISSAVEHLVSLGHRRIGHLAGPQDLSTGFGRYRAFLDAIQRFELAAADCPIAFADAYNEAAGLQAARGMLAAPVPPTAIMAGNDLIALGCLDAMAEVGLNCPADVSVIGFNDLPMLARLDPPLTTVHLPQEDIGAEAAKLLLDCINEPGGSAKRLLLPCHLTVRGSTASPMPPRPR